MSIDTSSPITDEDHSENDAADGVMTAADETTSLSSKNITNNSDNGIKVKNDNDNDNENKDNHQSGSGSDSDSDDSGSTSSENETDSDSENDSDSEKPADGISAYERLRIERIRRNEERLAQLGLVGPNQKLMPPKRRKRVSLGGASQQLRRSQPKRSAKKKLQDGQLPSGQIDLRRNRPLLVKRQKQPKPIVEKYRYSKRYRCGECRACKRQTDCRTCCFCSNNERQGSSSKFRRRCLFRMCLRRLIDVEAKAEVEVEVKSEVSREQKPQPPKPDDNDESADDHVCAEEKGESINTEEAAPCDEKISIDNAEYFESYGMEEDESGLPKWLDEFKQFMATVPHGPMNRRSGEQSIGDTVSQLWKLLSGEGVTYHLWPEGTHFKKGIKIHLGMDLWALHKEAVVMEHNLKDKRKGGLLRHPIAKMKCYKEWIASGKPKATKEPPMSPLLALPQPTTHSSGPNKDTNDAATPKKLVAMTVEDLIKPNRIKWSPDTAEFSQNLGVEDAHIAGNKAESPLANDDDKNITNNSVEDKNNDIVAAFAVGVKTESALANDDDNKTTTNDAVENGKTMKNAESADNVSTKPDTAVSQGDDNKNSKELLSNNNDVTKSSDDGEKDTSTDTAAATINETNSIDDAANKAPAYVAAATINKTSSSDTTTMVPSCCAICSRDGDLICCDGCNRGYHSNCHNPKIKEIPTGDWLCRECKRKKPLQPQKQKSSGCTKKEVLVNYNLFQGEHDDDCYICYLGGDLICCDFCEKAFHCACHIPPLPFIPDGIWKCCECSAVERKKKSRCGECKGCTRDDCGTCKHCLDKPKFGGFYKIRQVCVKRVCPYTRFAPPASSTTVAGAMTGKASTNKATPTKPATELNSVPSTGKKRGRPRKSVDDENTPTVNGTVKKRGPGRPRKSVDNESLPTSGNGKKSGRPRKSVDGENAPTINDTVKKRGPSRPRKSVDNENLPTNGNGKKSGRPRKSVENDNLSMNGSASGKKRGRPKKSVDSDDIPESKRVKIEVANEEMTAEPVVFRFKISSFNSAYTDPESIKIRRMIKTVLRDPSDSKVVDKSIYLLRKYMRSVESVKTAILFGGLEIVCNAMRDHLDKGILQAEACCTLAEMLWVFPDISTKLAHMGAIDLIITSIHSFPNHLKVQQMGCGALGALSYDENIIQQLTDAGGLRVVIAAMERFPKKLAVQKEGCYFVQNLIVRSIDALDTVSNSQVVSIIVEAMPDANSDTEFLLSVCGLIANLAVNQEARGTIGKSDAISALILVLNTTDDVEVKQAACTVLKNLASGSTYNQTKISEKGGLDAIFGAIRSDPNDTLLLVLSFNVMKELCINEEEVAYQIVKNGGIKIILKAMETNLDLAVMQVAACGVIGYLLLKGKSAIHAPKLVNAVISAMKHHSESGDVQTQGCDALFELSQVPTTRLILKKQDTQELLLRAKSHFKSCESDVDDIIKRSNVVCDAS